MEIDKRRVTLIGLIFLTIIIVGVFSYLNDKKKPEVETQQGTGTKIEELNPTSLPANMPLDLPIEPGTEVLENYQATSKDGRIQNTRRFTTKNTPDVAVKIYTNFFTKNAWKVANLKLEPGSANAILRRNDSSLTINVKRDSRVNSNVVEITITEPKTEEIQ